PLLGRRIEIGEARLDGLVLNLARDAQGRNNWQDLGAGETADAAPAAEDAGGTSPNVGLNVDVISVTNSEVNWNDAGAGSNWTLGDFNFTASNFGPDRQFPVETSFTVSGEALRVAVGAETLATLSLGENTYRLEDL